MNNNIYHFISNPMFCGKSYTAEITAINLEQACEIYFNAFVSGHSPLITLEARRAAKILYTSNYEYEMYVVFTPIDGCSNVYNVDFKSPRQ